MPSTRLPRSVWIVACVYLFVQIVLCLAYDAHHPAAFLSGDRSDTRMVQVQAMLNTGSFAEFAQGLLTSGLPGDYLWHTLLFMGADFLPQPRLGVVCVQIFLQTLAVIVTGLVALQLRFRPITVALGTTLYALFPHSIAFPHMLVSEAIFAPFVLYATYFTLRFARAPEQKKFGVLAGVCWAMAALTRPEALLAPFVAFLLLRFGRKLPLSRAALLLAAYLIPMLLWVVPSLAMTGNPNLSNRRPDQFNRLMHSKAEYLILLLPPETRQGEAAALERIHPAGYSALDLLSLYGRYPWKAVVANGLEAATLLFKFNETKLLNYFGIWDTDGSWRADLYLLSPIEFLKKHAAVVPLVAAGGLVWLMILLGSGYSVVGLWRDPDCRLIFTLVLYALLAGLVTDTTQARMRFCVDYAFALFSAEGYIRWRFRTKNPRTAS
jgi:4-amino-4-deoxy-L-arabinose transferase-like glycosyltransferase